MQRSMSVTVNKHGGFDCLDFTSQPLRAVGDNDVKVKVHYCGMNFADLYMRQGLVQHTNFPFILGIECVGIVEEVGKNVQKLKASDRCICYDHNGGLHRMTVVVHQDKCFTIADTVTMEEAACVFVNYLTAYMCLYEIGNLSANKKVFIHSCGGGVGIASIQLCRLKKDVTVYGTTSSDKAEALKGFGVNHVLNYSNYREKLLELCPNGVNIFIDNQAGGCWENNIDNLACFGNLILIGANFLLNNTEEIKSESLQADHKFPLESLIMKSISISGLHLGIICENHSIHVQGILDKIYLLVSQKKIHMIIDSIWPIEKIVSATKFFQSRRNIGKVLLQTKNVK